jgi:hypothetical protein
MTQDNPIEIHQHDDVETSGLFDAEVVKIGFCPDCGTTVIVLGDYERDVAYAHLAPDVLDGMINDLQSIRARLRN